MEFEFTLTDEVATELSSSGTSAIWTSSQRWTALIGDRIRLHVGRSIQNPIVGGLPSSLVSLVGRLRRPKLSRSSKQRALSRQIKDRLDVGNINVGAVINDYWSMNRDVISTAREAVNRLPLMLSKKTISELKQIIRDAELAAV